MIPKRPGTILGDRGETLRTHPTPRGVGLTRPPTNVARASTGAGIPHEIDDPGTGVVEGEDLRRIRAQRPTAMRLERLEDKHDETRRDVADLRESVGRVEGKLDVLPQLVAAVKEASDRANQREQVTFTASVEVDKAQKLGRVSAKLLDKELGLKVVAFGSAIAAIVLALIEARHC